MGIFFLYSLSLLLCLFTSQKRRGLSEKYTLGSIGCNYY